MRVAKYRVWDKEENIYFEPIHRAYKGELLDLSISLSGELLRRSLQHCSEHESIFPGRYEVEQFTGFHDKNGKEIYDGDILSDWTETEEGKVQSFYTVFWGVKKGQWRLDESLKQNRRHHWPLWSELKNCDFEITGNIHENPELLTRNS